MNKLIYGVLLIFLFAADALIPKPSRISKNSNLCTFTDVLTYSHPYNTCLILHDALKRFDERLRLRQPRLNAPINVSCIVRELKIELQDSCAESIFEKLWPSDSMNESYHLNISNNLIHIKSPQIWGALRGLETVAQLIYRFDYHPSVIYQVNIWDEPTFPHRGFLIDTSRHYLTLHAIYKFLDAMTMVKMNVLHWHIVDDQSFPYVSYTFPLLSSMGAFHPQAMIYTQNEIANILEYARLRGIRVMPEFDTPGHTLSWGRGYPDLLTKCYKRGKVTAERGPINPARESTSNFMFKFFKEILSVFPDHYLHLGGDEVSYDCWASNPEIQSFMKKMGFGEKYQLLEGYYIEQLITLLKLITGEEQHRIRTVVWQEIFEHGFRGDNSTVVHIWKQDNWTQVMNSSTKAGYNVLFSACWYLNYINYGADWKSFYECDPTNFGGTPEQISRVVGGEAAMWGEYVDETNLFSRSWPRGASVAERLWSRKNFTVDEFYGRLDELRCRMLKRGWNAEPVNGPGFCDP